jgi:hypothetical protein
MPKFKHFLITQFNLYSGHSGNKEYQSWVDWTRKRIEIFRAFCLPSIKNQNNKNFLWLIYFDKETPTEFYDLIEYLKDIPFILPYFTSGFAGFNYQYLIDIKNLVGDANWVITSRFDNDDCLDKNAIEIIQRNFRESDEFLISLASGYTLDIKDNSLSHYYYSMSPFISLIENVNKLTLKGIFFLPHTKWDDLRLHLSKELFGKNNKSIFILDKPYWLQIIHGDNISNSSRRGLPVLQKKYLIDFGINVTSSKQSVFQLPKYYNYVLWKRYFKATIVKLLK